HSGHGVSVPPSDFTTLELTMAKAGLGMMNGIAGFAFLDVRTTVEASGAETVTASRRNDGLPLMLLSRLNENATSAEVSCVPSVNLMWLRSLKVKVLAADDADCEPA